MNIQIHKMKKAILFILFLVAGIAFSQVTVNLQDQCNCEVLSGTQVITPGATIPADADIGDLYVNTTTGTIYFWDGDSWELTETDDQDATEVNLNTPIDVDGDSVDETTVQEAIVDLAINNALDQDINPTNEIQNIAEVLAVGNDAGGIIINDIGTPIEGNDAATKDYVDSQIIANVADGSETIVTGSGINSVSGTGTTGNPYIVTGTEIDGVIGNEILNATDATLTRNGTGVPLDPYTLDVTPSGITTIELADNAVTTAKLAADAVTNAKLADNAVNTENITNGTIATVDVADDAINATKINADVAGSGLTQNGITGALEVDATAISGDGDITSGGSIIITGTPTNSTFEDVNLEVNMSSISITESQISDLSHTVDTDDQDATEVSLNLAIDVDEGEDGGADTPTIETTVQEAIEAIAPITSKAARIFYPPSIAIDASATGTFTIDLYAEYFTQFNSPVASSDATNAPSIPTYLAGDLYYYVTYADPVVFDLTLTNPDPGEFRISAAGELTYTIQSIPATENTLINVVFVVK